MEIVKTKKFKFIDGKIVYTGDGTAVRDGNGVLYRYTEDYRKGITAQQRAMNEQKAERKKTGGGKDAEKIRRHVLNYCQKAGGGITVGQLANLLKEYGIETGRTRLYAMLEEDGYLRRTDSGWAATGNAVGKCETLDLRDYGMRTPNREDRIHHQPRLTDWFAADYAARVYSEQQANNNI
jgi:DNA-binding transcriptional regulator PaaX